MEPALYRWAISALAASVALIAVFFAVLRRSIRRAELRSWANAWAAEAAALVVVVAFWIGEPPASLHRLVFGVYVFAKTMYVCLLVRGADEFAARGPRRTGFLAPRTLLPSVLAFAVLGGLLSTTLDRLGAIESAVICVGFGWASASLLRRRPAGADWLCAGFAARSVLAAFEGGAYIVGIISASRAQPLDFLRQAGTLLAVHTSFDTGCEWLIALGCVIAVTERSQRELKESNDELLSVQSDLRRLADRDPLTALNNRRRLPEVFRSVQPSGAMLVFFDLDGFKQINDEHGHQVGDEYLRRFAAALVESFRPHDAIVRYAGDEFLVVAAGLDAASAEARVQDVRRRARASSGVPIAFSHGVAQLEAGGKPDVALRAADEAMYRAKGRVRV
jgi:diguanylate cyclase (GGDEF)-like protein